MKKSLLMIIGLTLCPPLLASAGETNEAYKARYDAANLSGDQSGNSVKCTLTQRYPNQTSYTRIFPD